MALKRDQVVAELAVAEGAGRIYVGEGGDEVFAENVLAPAPDSGAAAPRVVLPRRHGTP